ncbi:HAD family hydrolase [Pseudomonas typographi]|uniref:HAD family hydrolase n=1 Tax=Pseudomonas typographi TaxID=2715964 RepID=UPI001685D81D|nr:HAD family hydrolase [Pseudomonas typographi]MBD1589239.1 HAD family hydrolase [Pseudomonas typographi]
MSAGPIRLVLSDMDGTLLMPDHSISQPVKDAVALLRSKGCRVSLASSRPPRAMRAQVQALGIDDVPTAAFNGGTLVKPDGSYLLQHFVEPVAVKRALALFAQYPVSVWLFADDQWLVTELAAHYLQREHAALGYGPTQVADFTPYLDRVDKIVATCADFALLERLEGLAQGALQGQALAARSQAYYLDITALQANKGDALASLAKHLGIGLEQTAAIGDGPNDVAMFRRAGLAIAMGQGSEEVIAQAGAVTGSNTEHGVATAITQYILPRVPL